MYMCLNDNYSTSISKIPHKKRRWLVIECFKGANDLASTEAADEADSNEGDFSDDSKTLDHF